MNLVLVEDHHDLREALTLGLEVNGHTVTAFENAGEAEQHLKALKLNGQPLPDAVVVDLHLTNSIDGAELISRLRQEIAPHETLFALMSGSSDAEQRLREQHLLDVPFFDKAWITPRRLENKIKDRLRQREETP